MKLEGGKVSHHPADGVYPKTFNNDNVVKDVELKSGNEVTNWKHEDLSNTFCIDENWSEAGLTGSDHGEDCAGKIWIESEQFDHYPSEDYVEKMKDVGMAKEIVCYDDNSTCFEVKGMSIEEGMPSNMHLSSEKEEVTVTSCTEEESTGNTMDKKETTSPRSEVSKHFLVQATENLTSLNVHKDLKEAVAEEDVASENISDESTRHSACRSRTKGQGEESLVSCSKSPVCEVAATHVSTESPDCGVILGSYDIKNNTMNGQEKSANITVPHCESGFNNQFAVETAKDGTTSFSLDAPATSEGRNSANPVIPDKSKENAASTRQLESLGDRRDHGDSCSSYAGPIPISGSVTYSGPIAFSGSLSLRSDSSTTSTRSFAFPVLQNDWNSSPVRMGKGNRRLLQKNRGWRYGLLCCRF
ncbi:hypothetical protein MLD38_037972 [Melastoma candidum]|uniref:Uncharacterized protein n=1 Tax=Melastoma candidum TaxID=119954 RepID=A0ACB9KYF8_9MYRT|nr:hypothetical protein MLD38_037972 [Melastoma candidum]